MPDEILPKYPMTQQDENRFANDYTYHAPKEGQGERYTAIREAAGKLARFINEQCPPSRERSLALTHIENSVFYANAAIARHE
jgi:hypothetical protein